jgi:MFS family permease
VLHIALALLTFEPRPHTGGDNAAYITLARSLLERGAYLELWDPAEPPHTKYPPAFAAILAMAMAAGLQPWVQLKLVVMGFSASAVALSFLWIRARARAGLALGAGVIIAVAPGIMREGRWLLSDVPFWAFTMLALLAFERLRPGDWKRLAFAGVATMAAYMTRSAGLPLVLAALFWLAWHRRWQQLAGLATIVGIPALLWWLRSRAFATGAYVSEFWLIDPYQPALGTIGLADLVTRVVENVQKYVSIHLPILLADGPGPLPFLFGGIIFGLAVYGWTRRLRRARVADLFFPLYLGLIFVWPAIWSGERFLLPAMPLLLFYAGDGLVRLARRFTPRHDFAAAAAAAGLVIVLALPGLVAAAAVGRECSTRYLAGERYPCMGGTIWSDFFGLAETTGRTLPPDAVVLNRKSRLYYVLSGLKADRYPLSDEPDTFFAVADSIGARYVIFDQLDAVSDLYLRPILIRRSAAFCLMTVMPRTGTALFGIVGPADPARTDPALSLDGSRIDFPLCGVEYWRDEEAMGQYGLQ